MLRIYFAVLFREEANTTVALLNPLENMFLTIKIVPTEPLDGTVKFNFITLFMQDNFFLNKERIGSAGTPSYWNW